ncbi:ribbon-helix-helix domain-containing protein [Natronorubrum sp. DTA7]|uniref:ribbon-helix-helix domain-containing protein n=1 Tax=Natronorubrum sp. DTA7 TaxID=3447016 RepID=UPI003F87B7B2
MERVTHRMPEQLVDGLESLVDAGHYPNRSEALRDGARALLNEHSQLALESDQDDSADKPVRTDGNGLAVDPDAERERRIERREQYGTLNPAGQLLTSSELRAELPMLLARSNADGGRISSANGGEDTVTVELTYHVDGRLGVFGDGKTDPETIRVVRLGNVYAALEPDDTVRDLFLKTGVPTHVPETLADALECYAVVKSEHMGHYEPDPEQYVPYDLSDVEDGDDLETHLVSDLKQPVYTGDSDE